MNAVFRHELSSYFTGLTGYVFGAFILLFAGIYTFAYNLSMAYPNFEYVLSSMAFIFLIIVPILTMRVLSEELHQKTSQLLYSLPLSLTEIVLGKYFAMLVVFFIPTLVIGLYPLILSRFGNVYYPASYSALLGFFLLGSALLAIGQFISSLTESQAVAAGLCFVVMLTNYFIPSVSSMMSGTIASSLAAFAVLALGIAGLCWYITKNIYLFLIIFLSLEGGLFSIYFIRPALLAGAFPSLISGISLFERFNVFSEGVLDLTALFYFISVIGVFLFLTVQSLEKRRWSE